MKLRRSKKQPVSGRQRRQPVETDSRPVSSSYSYRTSRSEQADNTGRDTKREPTTNQPKHLGNYLLRRFGLIVLLIAVTISLINIASLSNKVTVKSISSTGAGSFIHDESEYSQAASKLLSESPLNKNKITVNTEHINKQMLKQFPELSNVSLTLPLLSKRPVLYIQTSDPALVLNTQQGSYVIDNSGKALILKDNLPDSVNLDGVPNVNDQSGLSVLANRHVLSSQSVNFIRTVATQLKAKNYTVSSMTLPASASQLDVNLEGQPYAIKFNLHTNDPKQQVGTFLATINKLQSQNVTPAQYVDVRVSGRAYYK